MGKSVERTLHRIGVAKIRMLLWMCEHTRKDRTRDEFISGEESLPKKKFISGEEKCGFN